MLVVGAGPAGATVARFLAAHGRCTILVDPALSATERLEVLSPPGRWLMEALDLTALLGDPAIVRPCLGIRRRWGTPDTELDDFLRYPGGAGFVLDRARFDTRLREEARRAGVQCVRGRVTSIRVAAGTVVARVAGVAPLAIAAAVALDASGRPAALARRLGARRLLVERLIAERQDIDPELDLGRQPAWLEVDGFGRRWSYEVPGPDGRRERWSVDCAAGGRHRGGGKRVDASAACLAPAAGESWIAVGDAAASFDPITSQGLVNALSTSFEAARLILSRGTIDAEGAATYSRMVDATFRHSEAGRASVYETLKRRSKDLSPPSPSRTITKIAGRMLQSAAVDLT